MWCNTVTKHYIYMVKGNSYDFAKMLLGPLVNPGWLLNPFGFSTSWLFQNKLQTILPEPTILLDLWRYLYDKPKLILLLFAIYSVNIDQDPDSFIQFSYFQSIPWSEIKIDIVMNDVDIFWFPFFRSCRAHWKPDSRLLTKSFYLNRKNCWDQQVTSNALLIKNYCNEPIASILQHFWGKATFWSLWPATLLTQRSYKGNFFTSPPMLSLLNALAWYMKYVIRQCISQVFWTRAVSKV